MVAAAYPTNVPRHSTAIQMLSGGRKSPGTQRPRVCLWLSSSGSTSSWSVTSLPGNSKAKPPLKLGWAWPPLTRDPNPGMHGHRAAEDASRGHGHQVATEEEAEAYVTTRARGQQAHAACSFWPLDEFHDFHVRAPGSVGSSSWIMSSRDGWGHAPPAWAR